MEKQDKDRRLQQFVSAMPKVELHAHLNGCIREETLFALAKDRNVILSSSHFGHRQHSGATTNSKNNSEENEELFSCMYNKKPRSLVDCFEMFAEIPKCVDDQDALARITREALEDFATHHVAYLELRSTPKRMEKNGTTKKQYLETVLEVMKSFEEQEGQRFRDEQETSVASDSQQSASRSMRIPMKCRFIVSIDRSGSVEEADENVDLAIKLFQAPNSFVVGVDLGGNPTRNDFRDFQSSMSRAREAGLRITVHCAEVPVGESESEADPLLQKSYEEVAAIFKFKPDRLGHALLLKPSLRSKLMGDECSSRIPVEACPTSNVMTLELAKEVGGNLIHGLQEHPQLKYWLEKKYPISIGTDDPGVFNTNATQELLLLAKAWNVSSGELQRITLDSIDQAFCGATLKASTKARIEARFLVLSKTSN